MCPAQQSRPAAPLPYGVEEAQREQAHKRRAAPELLSVLAVELPGIPGGIRRRRIALVAARAAAARANPAERGALAREAKPMPEERAAPQ
jgi:hypothetical protein